MAPGEYAQDAEADGQASLQPIGTVETIQGTVRVVRVDGTTVTLEEGDQLFQGDVIATDSGSAINLVFVDGTEFAMDEDGRMVLDELIYDPATGDGSSVFSVIEGGFSFVSGEIANSGPDAMVIQTTVATVGIRGTQVALKAAAAGGELVVVLLEEEGETGEIIVFNDQGSAVLNLANQVTVVTSATIAPSAPLVRSEDEIAELFGTSFDSLSLLDFRELGELAPEAGGEDGAAGTLGFGVNPDLLGGGGGGGLGLGLLGGGGGDGGGGGLTPIEITDRPTTVLEPLATEPPPAVLSFSAATGAEDTAIPIPVTVELLESAETGEATLRVEIENVPDGALLSAGTDNGGGLWSFEGAQLDALPTLTITPPQDFSGALALTVRAVVTDDLTGEEEAVAADLPVTVTGVADAPLLDVDSALAGEQTVGVATGDEDTAIALDISAATTDIDGSETLNVTIAGIPDGATLSAGTDIGGGLWSFEGAQLDALPTLTITPPPDSDADFELSIEATATEAGNGDSATTTGTIKVTVDPVADEPTLAVGVATGDEDDEINLDIRAVTTDLDGSETLNVTIAGIPDGATIAVQGTGVQFDPGGIDDAPNTLTLPGVTQAVLNTLTITPPLNDDADFELSIEATATEAGNADSKTTLPGIIEVSVAGFNDPPILSGPASDLDYTENDAPTIVNGTLIVDDPDDLRLQGATVSIAAPAFEPGEDVLGFVDTAEISGVYNAGVLTLSGAAKVADYQAALRSVTYANSSDDPSTAARTIDFQVSDGPLTSNIASTTVNVAAANDTPSAGPDAGNADEDGTTLTAAFQGDDVDSDDNQASLVYAILGQPSEGSVVNNGNGTFTFDPGANFQDLAVGEPRIVSFQYTATDSHGATSAPGTVTITVTGANDGPIAQAVSAPAAVEDGPPVTAAFDADDVDSDDGPASPDYAISSPATGGSVVNNGDGTFTFTPDVNIQDLALGENRSVTFEYTATDSHGATSAPATVSIDVTGVNDAPVAQLTAAAAAEDGATASAAFQGDDIDSDDDQSTLTYAILAQPSEGAAVNNGNGTFTFDPEADFQDLALGEIRLVSFQYTATDSHGGTRRAGHGRGHGHRHQRCAQRGGGRGAGRGRGRDDQCRLRR